MSYQVRKNSLRVLLILRLDLELKDDAGGVISLFNSGEDRFGEDLVLNVRAELKVNFTLGRCITGDDGDLEITEIAGFFR